MANSRTRNDKKNNSKKNIIKENDSIVVSDVFRILKKFLKEFKNPLAWFFIILGLIFSTKALDLVRSLRHQEPVFIFLKSFFEEIGGIFSYKMSGFRYIKRIPAIFYQMVIPLIFVWITYYFTKPFKRKINSGFKYYISKFKNAVSTGNKDYGLSTKCLKKWSRLIFTVFLIMLPFIYFFSTTQQFKRKYPYLSKLRQQRKIKEKLLSKEQIKYRLKRKIQLKKDIDGLIVEGKKSKSKAQKTVNKNNIKSKFGELFKLENTINNWFWNAFGLFILFQIIRMFYMFSWEFLFRGFMLNGLRDKFKYNAIFIQMIPYVLLHSTKPGIELYYTIPSSLLLGLLAYETRSIWPGFLLHFVGAVIFDFCAMFL